MLDEDAQGAANRFIKKLENGNFKMARSKNDAEDYDIAKQERDSEAVRNFTQTPLFKDIFKDITENN